MARKATCPFCSTEIERDSSIRRYNGKQYHLNCYKKMMEKRYEEEKLDEDPRGELYKYICEAYGTEEVSPMIIAQIEKLMMDNKSWGYIDIMKTIKYVKEIENTDLIDNPVIRGVGFLPYKYELAKQYYSNLEKSQKSLVEQIGSKTSQDFVKQKTVKIKADKREEKVLIDLETL